MDEMFLQAEPFKASPATCIPRLRGGGGSRRPPRRRSAPAATTPSVMDRLRDVLLRLAMLSAASSSTKGGRLEQQTLTACTPSRGAASARMSPSSALYSDAYRSEAVDECIEFLKRSAAGRGHTPAVNASVVVSSASPLHASACAMGI